MAFKILIVEDEDLYADELEMLLDKLGYTHLATVDNSKDALQQIEKERPDMILMDIHIKGGHDGIELADLIHREYPIPVIFITSLKDDLTFSRASRTKPVQFLIKPFDQLQLQRIIELCVKQLSEENKTKAIPTEEWDHDFLFKTHFFIKTRQRIEKVAIEEVLYLESDGHYCQVHTADKKFLVRGATSELLKRLPKDTFIQTHRSYWVKINKVEFIDLQDSVIIFAGGKQVPVSKRNRDLVLKQLKWI